MTDSTTKELDKPTEEWEIKQVSSTLKEIKAQSQVDTFMNKKKKINKKTFGRVS